MSSFASFEAENVADLMNSAQTQLSGTVLAVQIG
jgi:hypothetical protein